MDCLALQVLWVVKRCEWDIQGCTTIIICYAQPNKKNVAFGENNTRITRGARPALAAFFRARQYPCSRFPVYDPAAHELVVPATMMMLQLIVPKFRPHPPKES